MTHDHRTPQAIVFDFDGVLVDTETLHLRSAQEALAALGLELDEKEYYARYVGFDDEEMFRQLAADRHLRLGEAQLARLLATKVRRFAELQERAALVPGAAACVRRLAAVAPLAIASGARRDEIERLLVRTGLAGAFTAIVAAGETPRGKPAPDPYARAVALLGADARCAVAIEDTPAGLESARAAGLRCIGLTTTFARELLDGADAVVASLDEVTPALLAELVGRR
ncbi:MAG TPA: HAD family phosphatase [Vicinamibacterales bacterium]|nr:HAD family phosphatase [Vicinamibacterales bacterium]